MDFGNFKNECYMGGIVKIIFIYHLYINKYFYLLVSFVNYKFNKSGFSNYYFYFCSRFRYHINGILISNKT